MLAENPMNVIMNFIYNFFICTRIHLIAQMAMAFTEQWFAETIHPLILG